MTSRRPLLRDPEFLKYWTAETIVSFGFPVAGLAIPLTAVLILAAGPAEMGAFGAAQSLPFLVFGLAAGVIVDRFRRKPVMIAAELAIAAVLALIPLAAALGLLRMELLYVVAFATGSIEVVATVAYQAFLPTLVGRDRLIEANSRVQMSASTAQIVGPGLGGVLVQLLTAPFAILATAVTATGTAVLLLWTKVTEPPPRPSRQRGSIIAEVREGLELIAGDRHLRAIMLTGTTHNVFSNGMLVALEVLFATKHLGLTPAELGLVFAAGGPGSLLGSLVADRLPRIVGLGLTIGAMQVLTGVARLFMPLAAVAAGVVAPALVLAAGEFTLGIARTVFNVNQLSLRQSITPDHQQGRMNASIRFLMWGVVPFGALLGGYLGETIGILPTLWIGVAGTFAAAMWIFLSPVRSLRDRPEPLAE